MELILGFESIIKTIIICATLLLAIWLINQGFFLITTNSYKSQLKQYQEGQTIPQLRDHCINQTHNIMFCWRYYENQ